HVTATDSGGHRPRPQAASGTGIALVRVVIWVRRTHPLLSARRHIKVPKSWREREPFESSIADVRVASRERHCNNASNRVPTLRTVLTSLMKSRKWRTRNGLPGHLRTSWDAQNSVGRPMKYQGGAVPNERLRGCISVAGLTVAELAQQVGVNRKTVERWITTNRLPYREHRWKTATILGRDETYLWPELNDDPVTQRAWNAEFVQIY